MQEMTHQLTGVCVSPQVSDMFCEWDQMLVRLDVWHLMRRLARGVTTDSHQLYGAFMGRLTFALFEWDQGDVDLVKRAKQAEGCHGHIAPTAKELARHCRRRVRSVDEAERLVQEVLDHYAEATDLMGVKLIDRARMAEIWRTQRRHLHCIQDPPGLQLYTKTRETTRGGGASSCLPLCTRLHLPGVVPPPPDKLHPR